METLDWELEPHIEEKTNGDLTDLQDIQDRTNQHIKLRKEKLELLPLKWKEIYGKYIERRDIQTFSEKEEFIGVVLPLRLYQNGYVATRLGKILILLYNIWEFPAVKKLTMDEKMNLCINIELACYTYVLEKAREDNVILSWNSVNFCNYYHEICAKFIAHLDSRVGTQVGERVGTQGDKHSNDFLINSIIEKKISIMNLPRLYAFELCPEKYEEILSKINKARDVSFTIKTTTMYTCRKCYARECRIENRQNRSLDEGVNLTITCMNCQHTWNG